jgi:hypothetical protein
MEEANLSLIYFCEPEAQVFLLRFWLNDPLLYEINPHLISLFGSDPFL